MVERMARSREAMMTKITSILADQPTPFNAVVEQVGYQPRTVREMLMKMEKIGRAEMVAGAGWRLPSGGERQ